ncbi:fatty acid desaturase [Nostoc sp. 3335mG]|nr:fatty acid desaturase [Nostoc sp. 3335mG]
MNQSIALDRRSAGVAPAKAATSRIADDRTLLRTAAEISRDLNTPQPAIYWTDLLLSAAIGYGALFAAMTLPSVGLAVLAGVISALALYRAGSFIHELTHVKSSALPGFRVAWNAMIGVPLMVPSFMYEGVHNLHHARTRYGTVDDPEYLPLALMKPWTLPVFVIVSILAPVALSFRYAVLAPLSVVIPPLRKKVVEEYSGLVINPAFRRRHPEGAFRRDWHLMEAATSVWAITLLTLVATGIIPLKAFLIFLAVAAGTTLINQVRTLVAHLWENDGEAMTVTAQYLDSVNVPPPALLPMLWAPVGLRYHALHHLLPGVPYHGLAEAHRRLVKTLDADSPYHKGNYPGLPGLVGKIVRSTMIDRR